MSLQDDVWDVEHALMGTEAAKSYAKIVKRLWAQEQHNAELVEANNTFYKAFKLIRNKCTCDIENVHSEGAKYCWKCGGFIEAAK